MVTSISNRNVPRQIATSGHHLRIRFLPTYNEPAARAGPIPDSSSVGLRCRPPTISGPNLPETSTKSMLTSDTSFMDRIDRQIMHCIQRDGRASFRRIAEVLGVSEQTVAR